MNYCEVLINQNMKIWLSMLMCGKYKFIYRKNITFYDILYLWIYYQPVNHKLPRNFLVDPSWRQVGHPWYIMLTLFCVSQVPHVVNRLFRLQPAANCLLKKKQKVSVLCYLFYFSQKYHQAFTVHPNEFNMYLWKGI